ncbi:MAG: InlB B-repeat-containing protein, partial [Candidatus Promineifilaceae bacterium]
MFRKQISLVTVLFSLLMILFLLNARQIGAATVISFTGEELLGKPTDTSITINIIPASNIEYYYEYGTSTGGPYTSTALHTATGGQPDEVVLTGLSPNTRYYYRMRYHAPGEGSSDWITRDEHTFHTQRAEGETFTFTIISDSHAMYNTQYQTAIGYIAEDLPDFHMDLGDTFMTDNATSQTTVNNAYLAQREPLYMDAIGHSSPIFLASGNHENEEGWNLDDDFSIALASIKARKAYFPTPVTDGFYTGNEDPLPAINAGTYGDQLREDYYAWEWGDALFVVFDPFQYTMANPYGATAGESSDDPATGDRWNWSLGQDQYYWLKETLENSDAKYKFMFAHHMLGGTQNYVRGGAVPAHMFEWGGYGVDGTTWEFAAKRTNDPEYGFEDPIRQLMIENDVTAFFHGHDHQYAYEVRDGIVYLSMPRPSTGLDFNYYDEADEYTERVISNAGYLRVTVGPTEATAEYVRSSTTGVSHEFVMLPNIAGESHDLTMAVQPAGSGTTSPSAGVHAVAADSDVTVTAAANSGFEFDHWSGACSGSAACVVTMDSDKSVTANFTSTGAELSDDVYTLLLGRPTDNSVTVNAVL